MLNRAWGDRHQAKESLCRMFHVFLGFCILILVSQVYSPYQKNWIATLNDNLVHYLEECPEVSPNNKTCKLSEKLAPLFDTPIPEHLDGFELETNNKRKMREVWPEGEDTAVKVSSHPLSVEESFVSLSRYWRHF